MKRIVLLFLISSLIAGSSSGQKLLDLYKKGPVKLVPDKTYGAKNNWDLLFNLYYDTLTSNAGPEWNKRIVIAPDGSVFMSHRNRHEIWKFGPDGNFVKKFGSKGSKPGQFVYRPSVHPIIENKYVLTSDVGGRLNLFDLDGNFIKKIGLRYMGLAFQPTGNDNILLTGYTGWKTKSRHMVVRLNVSSGHEDILYDYFTDYPKQVFIDNVDSLINVKKGNFNFRIPGGYTSNDNSKNITFLRDGKFLVSDSKSGEYSYFTADGKELLKARLEIEPVKVTEADVLANYEGMKKNLLGVIEAINPLLDPNSSMRLNNPDWSSGNVERQLNSTKKWIDNLDIYRDIKNYYPYFPYFSNMISDDEGNLLVFEYTNTGQKEDNIFNVIAYDGNGQKLARTSFICDDYNLYFSDAKFVISKGYVYAIANLKNTTGMPLRLVKLKITN